MAPSSTSIGRSLEPSPGTPSLIELALQHNHWAAVPLLIEAGVPWPQGFQPSPWDVQSSQRHKQDSNAQYWFCMEVGS
jgi:hypothetical protein